MIWYCVAQTKRLILTVGHTRWGRGLPDLLHPRLPGYSPVHLFGFQFIIRSHLKVASLFVAKDLNLKLYSLFTIFKLLSHPYLKHFSFRSVCHTVDWATNTVDWATNTVVHWSHTLYDCGESRWESHRDCSLGAKKNLIFGDLLGRQVSD